MTDDTREGTILTRIVDYLSSGGLFNPEHVVPQDAVRDLIMDCRTEVEALRDQLRAMTEERDELKTVLRPPETVKIETDDGVVELEKRNGKLHLKRRAVPAPPGPADKERR